ncbi:hypothetical protein SAMN05444487_101352 [Marininema mesophilum]|uniref:Uncharacterized protein n=1 Tax=Marininema mesophilum TaxID=1048340 RepID=A0A1H2R0Y9_9BACL|nr:hypothetical protein [Marininema mesophilum]SDW13015.1 hypothetical protein SAMN05444487_101352 [Marininema mesophilum]
MDENKTSKIEYEYHHIGIPTDKSQKDERYSPLFKMYTSDSESKDFRVQWHRFEPDSSIHPLIQRMPHIAFKVNDIQLAIEGKKVILEPYYPFERFCVAMIEEDGLPIELIETDLKEEEIWSDSHKNSTLYPDSE